MRNYGIALLAAFALALPATAKQVTCKDGTTSDSGRGACSHHGGVDKASKKEKKSTSSTKATKKADNDDQRSRNEAREPVDGNARAENNGGILGGLFGRRNSKDTPRSETRDNDAARGNSPTAVCKDGTKSYSQHHSGTCSGHGGVRQWLDK